MGGSYENKEALGASLGPYRSGDQSLS